MVRFLCLFTFFCIFADEKTKKNMLLPNIPKMIVVTVLFSVTLSLSAQNKIRYSYDAAGNRTKREIVIEPQKAPEAPHKAPGGKNNRGFDGKYTADIHNNDGGNRIVASINGLKAGERCRIDMYSVKGELVMRHDMDNGSTVIDMGCMQNGVYLMRITINGMSETWKITKK